MRYAGTGSDGERRLSVTSNIQLHRTVNGGASLAVAGEAGADLDGAAARSPHDVEDGGKDNENPWDSEYH